MASKYDALAEHLRRQSGPSFTMSFDEIARLVGTELPASSRTHRPWWGNDRSSHPQSKDGWIAAGWEVESVDQVGGVVTFSTRILRPFRFGVASLETASGSAWTEFARRAEALGYAT